MRRIVLRLAIATLTFLIGVAASGLWTVKYYHVKNLAREADCIPNYYSSPDSVNTTLDRFEEMSFEELPACVDESYRLIWIPAFHAPLSIRIWRSGEKQFIVTKQLDGKGGYGMGDLALHERLSLSDDEWNESMRLLRQTGYWDMPSLDNSPLPNDGALWVIEGLHNRKYHRVARRSPSPEFRSASIYLVKLSGLKTEIERY